MRPEYAKRKARNQGMATKRPRCRDLNIVVARPSPLSPPPAPSGVVYEDGYGHSLSSYPIPNTQSRYSKQSKGYLLLTFPIMISSAPERGDPTLSYS